MECMGPDLPVQALYIRDFRGDMKSFICKIIAGIVIFSILLLGVQQVLHYRWPEDTYTRYIDYAGCPEGSVDAFVFGTSEMYAGYSPVAGYNAAGFTAYNFAIQNRSAMTTYYQFKYAIKYQKPKVVICDFVCLFDSMLPSESETVYRRAVDTMPDREIKSALINEICRVDRNESPISWYLPVLRYHSMWNELEPIDFVNDKIADINYPGFKKGVNIMYSPFDGEPYDITPELWENGGERAILADFSMYYYDKLIKECQDMGIDVVCVLTPKISDAAVYAVNYPVMQEYFASRGVKSVNYCDMQLVNEMGLNLYDDYADAAHLNAMGIIKFSNRCARDISKMCNLPDRRLDSDDEVTRIWNGLWDDMVAYYGTLER